MNPIMPDPVVDLIESRYPHYIQTAARKMRQGHTAFLLCRTEFTAEARERSISTMHAAAKVLATYPQATEVVR
ncbi:hypothetical protein ADK52_25325 [Streptomyces sp. WM6372]|uniref:hypothetical protein n=1 Tax=Streptomyces sp. WM6372 TaxID=1415555 RepID=UPI0006AFE854|nr:hypothetical protein [Streptomyces sp. WM6372]KOU20917.1 hypothetical protein ADK52_25325 [Streptomyces sp. WM6372]